MVWASLSLPPFATLMVILFKLIQYYCHWVMGECEDVSWSDSLVACGYGCRTTSVGHIHHLSVTPPIQTEGKIYMGQFTLHPSSSPYSP